MKYKKTIRCITILLIICCSIVAVTSCGQKENPVEKMTILLDDGNYEKAVSYYNDNEFEKDVQNSLNELLTECVYSNIDTWDESEEAYTKAHDVFVVFAGINNQEISKIANEWCTTIECENTGNEILDKAENAFKDGKYIETMQFLSEVETSYSQYESLEILYNDCKTILLADLVDVKTIAEYENAIQMLTEYITVVNDPDFQATKESLEIELATAKDIQNVLLTATDQFEKELYKESFDTLDKGLKKYPENNKITYTISVYQYAFIMNICGQVVDLMDEKKYDEAEALVDDASLIYPCEAFDNIKTEIREESSFLFAIKNQLKNGGEYVFRSGKKFILGDFDENEQETLLSLCANFLAALTNADAPLDIRDLAYDITNWGEGEYFGARFAIDAISIIPVIGAAKYIKHIDEIKDTAKLADDAKDAAKYAKEASQIAKNAKKVFDFTDAVSDIRKKADVVLDLSDNMKDSVKKAPAIKEALLKLSKSDKLENVVDISGNEGTAIAKKLFNHYEQIPTRNQNLLGKVHPRTGVKYGITKLELSDGKNIKKVKGVFAKFDTVLEEQLPKDLYKASEAQQKKYLGEVLQKQINTPTGRKKLEKIFDADQIKEIEAGNVPTGYTWHHNEKEGLMQLVNSETHAATGHTGGMSIWGKDAA